MSSWHDATPGPRALAPEVAVAHDEVLAALPTAAPGRLLEVARRRIAQLLPGDDPDPDGSPPLTELDPADIADLRSWPTSERFDPLDRAALELTEQFVVDVAGTDDALRGRCFAALGDVAFPFAQGVYVLDQDRRVRAALRQLFGPFEPTPTDRPAEAPVVELWPALEQWMRAVAQLDRLDPITTELVRLRGARAHDCRLCRSRRLLGALDAGADETTFDAIDDYESSTLDERHKVALRLTDAMIWTPTSHPPTLAEQVRRHFSPEEALEIVDDVARNAANKIAVLFGADEPNVVDGVELYELDASGDVVGVGVRPA